MNHMNYQYQLTDQELITEFMNGDPQAIGTLLMRYKDRIFTSIYLFLKDRQHAEDMFQEVFIKVTDGLKKGQYADSGKFFPWVMRIAHNKCLDYARKIKRRPATKITDNVHYFESSQYSEAPYENAVINRENMQMVNNMLNHLPEEQREVIILRHYANLSFKEIASMTNTNINTALGRMRYGLLSLRKMAYDKKIAV